MIKIKQCPKCKAENPIVANFCRKCRYEFSEATKNGFSLKPEIKYFHIKELQYVIGSKIHIEWDAENYSKIELAGKDVTLYKDVELYVEEALELDLIVYNDYDQVKQSLRIIPHSSPNIHSFFSSHSYIKVGKTTKLTWSVDYTKKVLLKYDENEIDVSTLTELEVSPTKDTLYTLIVFAVDEQISISRKVNIKVLSEVMINDFSSDIPQTLESQPVELKWSVTNADKIILYPNDIDVTQQTSIKVYPNRAITYRLEASNAISIKEQMVSIGVRPLPRLDIKVSDSLSRLQIPNCDIDLTPLITSIKETELDRWLLSPTENGITKKILGKGVWNRLKNILSLKIKL